MAVQRLRKDDTVVITAGRERGKTGKILRVLPEGNVDKEASIHASNVQPLCGRCNKPARVGRRRSSDGTSVRLCRRCNDTLETA
jgi:large subunit ribosomal protein L24